MFAIDFLPDSPEEIISGERSRYAAVELSGLRERVLVPLTFWSVADYRHHWREALRRTAAGHPRSALITCMYDPRTANFIQWWPLYRVAGWVFVQNQILFMSATAGPFHPSEPYVHVPERRTRNEDGERLSEWGVGVEDLQGFLTDTAEHWR